MSEYHSDHLRWPCAECGKLGHHDDNSDCCTDCSRQICKKRGIEFYEPIPFADAMQAASAARELKALDQKRWPMTAMRLRKIIAKGTHDWSK